MTEGKWVLMCFWLCRQIDAGSDRRLLKGVKKRDSVGELRKVVTCFAAAFSVTKKNSTQR